MKYFKKSGEVYAFELDGSQDYLITAEFVELTHVETDQHLNPQKYLTSEQKQAAYLVSLKPLTRRQFKLTLLENGLLEQIETAIANIEDSYARAKMQIEYGEALEFHRTSDTVAYMAGLLELGDNEINQMWEYAMSIPI